uniref:V-type proton ATPase subunit E3 n=1 Tax=Noccaea caerulescens TaxID=107243 RepID=A0A1J3K484_NOCCA
MNQADANKQIDQMIAFIMQEAKEKAEEIRVKTEKEFMADKLSIETQQNVVIRQEHEKAKKQALIQKKIEKSKKSAETRFAIMRARNDRMNELKEAVIKRLAVVSKGKQYADLVRFLIAQGLMTILENHVRLRVRQEDLQIVKTELPAAIKLFQKTMHDASGVTPNVNVEIDTEFLPPGPVEGKVGNFSCGGVELHARGSQIICRNTLDHRLDLAFDALKPSIRAALFGVRAKDNSKPKDTKKHLVRV